MKKLIFPVLSLMAMIATAQDTVAPLQYDMTFIGRGEATNVQSVKVENLSRQTELNLNGDDILRLTNIQTTDIGEVQTTIKVKPLLYPNPSFGAARLVFANRVYGDVTVSVTDMLGKTMLEQAFKLDAGKHSVVLPSLKSGVYIVSLRGNGVNETMKWLSNGEGSTGSIRLEGSNGLELPTETNYTTTKPSQKADSNIVRMYYEYGELLRFTGKSGNMTTIVMNQPTISHPITFDFYACTDAAGRHYPIVNVGGILWMAEDLGVVPTKATLRTSASAWSSYTTGKVAYRDFDANSDDKGGYYNWEGAKAALPNGWSLPTAGEVDAMFQALGMTPIVNATTKLTTGYNNPRQDLLRSRDNSWAMPETAPDTTSFGAMASGTLSATGVFNNDGDYKAAFWTRSSKNNLPIWWGITDATVLFSSTQTANIQQGFRVRGCRVAPSSYQNVIDKFTTSNSVAPKRKLFDNGPLGGAYVVSSEKKKIFADYNPLSSFYRYNCSSSGTYSKTLMPNPSSGVGRTVSTYLKKATAVKNGNNRENLVVATWNRPFIAWSSGDKIYGNGTVSLVIFNDSINGYALVDSITLPGAFTMDNYSNMDGAEGYIGNIFAGYIDTYEQYISRFQVLAADFDGDGVDEIVINLDRKVVVYKRTGPDWKNWTQLYTKTFTTHTNTDSQIASIASNVRIAVGDADGDKTPDIAAIYEQSAGFYRVELYSAGDISKSCTALNNFSKSSTAPNGWVHRNSPFHDIKIGNAAGHSINTIVVMVAHKTGTSPKVCLFEYGGGATLEEIANYGSGNVQYGGWPFTYSNHTFSFYSPTFNDNVTLVNFDGAGSKSDIVAGLDILTYIDDGAGSGTLSKKATTSLCAGEYCIFPDFITAGNFNGNEQGKEQLNVMRLRPWIDMSVRDDNSYTLPIASKIYHSIVTVSGSTLSETSIYSPPDTIPSCNALQATFYHRTGNAAGIYTENGCSPFVASARSAEASKTLKYIDTKTTMSEPRIYALLAAPPFWKYKPDGTEYTYSGSMGTAWGRKVTSGTGSNRVSSNKASVILGYEQEFNLPLIGTKVGGIEFEAKLEFEWEKSEETTVTESQSIDFTTQQNDAVILTATFYDSYTYEVMNSGNPDEIGAKIIISFPESEPRTMGLNLEDYKRLMEDCPTAPRLDKLFNHKVGYPLTYPSSKAQIVSNVLNVNDPTQPSGVLWAANLMGSEFVDVGSGNDVTRSIELTKETETSSAFNFNVEAELVATALGVKIGAGYGHGESWGTSHSESEGHAIAGTVCAPINLSDVQNFQWTICWYKYYLDGQTFPVIYYVVRK